MIMLFLILMCFGFAITIYAVVTMTIQDLALKAYAEGYKHCKLNYQKGIDDDIEDTLQEINKKD